jgi:streptomycin 6-kinase
VELPPEVLGKVAALGPDGRRWVDDLPALIASLERRWRIVVGRSLRGGTESYVAEATLASGRRAVLKVGLPGSPAAHAIDCLLRAAGHGYVSLLACERRHGAMLMERLGAPLGDADLPVSRQVEIICTALGRAWNAPPDPAFPSGAEKARSLRRFIEETWRELGRPVSGAAMRQVGRFARARENAFDARSAVLAHGDPHPWNLLFDERAARYTFIDPEGLFIERAYDLGVVMREWSDELIASGDAWSAARARCARLGRLTGVDAGSIWEWGFLERVATGLLALKSGLPGGATMLSVAEVLAQ